MQSRNIGTGIITGATGGLGRKISIKLASECSKLILTSTHGTKMQSLLKEIRLINPDLEVSTFILDLSRREDIDRLGQVIQSHTGPIDFLINNAATFSVKNLSESDYELLSHDFHLNFFSAFLLSRAYVEKAKLVGRGCVINVGSSSAYGVAENTSVYASTKHALLALSRTIKAEYANFGIRSIFLAPGSMQTEMGRQVPGQDFSTFIEPEQVAEFIHQSLKNNSNMIIDEVRINRMIYK